MASGDNLGLNIEPTIPASTAVPALGSITGGSTIAERFRTFDFDAAAIETMDFTGRLSDRYSATGIQIKFAWAAASATTGNVVWQVAIRRLNSAEIIANSHSYSAQSSTDGAAGTLTQLTETAVTLTHGAQMDSLAAGEPFLLRIWRDATNGADTMAGDAQMVFGTIAVVEP